ncbi:unnamed protein product [Clonostachys chloroleuca]|uniref:Uncharacterized protein n=1 Tax=Clonostachys chloroleuca TaxID=1926264 RepID=A0AA35LY51_9HYPO|nr:unnamed protein product [Clonostachys chloroleuca]
MKLINSTPPCISRRSEAQEHQTLRRRASTQAASRQLIHSAGGDKMPCVRNAPGATGELGEVFELAAMISFMRLFELQLSQGGVAIGPGSS